MGFNPNNIEIGEGDLTLKFEGEGAATDVGGCEDAELDIKLEDLDVSVGQVIDPIDSFDVGRTITFKITMKEATMRNFVIAMGGNPSDINTAGGKDTYEFPANNVTTSKYAELIYKVARVRNKNKFRTITLWKVKSRGGLNKKFNKKKEVMYVATFQAYADSNHGNSPGKFEIDNL